MTGRARRHVSQPRPDQRNVQPMSLALASDDDLAHALEVARERFRPEMDAAVRALRRSLHGRDPRQLAGEECLHHLEVRERFLELAAAQAAYAEACLVRGRQRIAA